MRTIVIGDLHGNDIAFRKALKTVSLKKEDKLILLGDLIDRGRDSKGVLDTIILLLESGFKNIICLRGNHEQMLLDAFYDASKEAIWLKNGGDKTLLSFMSNFTDEIPLKYIKLIETFDNYHIQGEDIFVHAGLNLKIDNPLEDIKSMLWIRNMDIEDLSNTQLKNFRIIHGHTPKKKNEIIEDFNTSKKVLCLDNGGYLNEKEYGQIVVADLTNNKIFFI